MVAKIKKTRRSLSKRKNKTIRNAPIDKEPITKTIGEKSDEIVTMSAPSTSTFTPTSEENLGLNLRLTKYIYDIVNSNTFFKEIPFWLGLLPYEVYVIPFMYLGILQVIWLGSPNDIQLHLLPHWFSFSFFQLIKGKTKIERPGCKYPKQLGEHIDQSHCEGKNRHKSFPSGHTGIAFSLATTLMMEMCFSDLPAFFEVPITNSLVQKIIAYTGYFVAIMTALQRVSKGYHSLLDITVGACIGIMIGIICWCSMQYYKSKYFKVCRKTSKNDDKICEQTEYATSGVEYKYWFKKFTFWGRTKSKFFNAFIGGGKIVITIIVCYLFFSFVTNDLWNLRSLKH